MAKEFSITGGHTVIVDDDLLHLVSAVKWHAKTHNDPRYIYACKRAPNSQFLGQRVFYVYMHRLIISAAANDVVDHINGNTLDNRRENLRVVSNKENAHDFARRKFGNDHCQSKFDDADIEEIFRLRSTGVSYRAIAKEFGVGHTIIRNICTGNRGKGTQIKPTS